VFHLPVCIINCNTVSTIIEPVINESNYLICLWEKNYRVIVGQKSTSILHTSECKTSKLEYISG
jgi:hypothetical protein